MKQVGIGPFRKGHWSVEEDIRLIQFVRKYGEGRWSKLAKAAGLQRCGKSCRLRWVNYLRPDIKRGHISDEEESLIIKLHSILGNRWSLIAIHLPGRSDNEIKNYWRSHIKKKLKEMDHLCGSRSTGQGTSDIEISGHFDTQSAMDQDLSITQNIENRQLDMRSAYNLITQNIEAGNCKLVTPIDEEEEEDDDGSRCNILDNNDQTNAEETMFDMELKDGFSSGGLINSNNMKMSEQEMIMQELHHYSIAIANSNSNNSLNEASREEEIPAQQLNVYSNNLYTMPSEGLCTSYCTCLGANARGINICDLANEHFTHASCCHQQPALPLHDSDFSNWDVESIQPIVDVQPLNVTDNSFSIELWDNDQIFVNTEQMIREQHQFYAQNCY